MRIRCGEGGCSAHGNGCADRHPDPDDGPAPDPDDGPAPDSGGAPVPGPGPVSDGGPDDDRCAVCDRAGAADGARWSLLSRHPSSQGVVEYCACRCGGVVVLVDGGFAKILPGRAPDRTGERGR
ncbi:hypothetical protein [Streptomyces sp. NPDC059142]|uniref:hypothetical protein n=1 Tax=Streptomyces sp. NPDC059142 TaxID=3346739 RepID=UPI003682C281